MKEMLKTTHMALTILLVLAAGGILASHAQNDRWAYIISGKNGTRVYLEKTYRELDNGNRLIWAKYERQAALAV